MKKNNLWSMILMLVLMVSASLSVSSCSDDDDEEIVTLMHNGHAYVDLGLPSGLKWATMNIGATSPEDYGWYLAWGETEPKEYYDKGTYTDSKDDAAHVNWGGDWRMPTMEEQSELISNCTWTWTKQKGVKGYKVTSKKNGNSIFLPAAGRRNREKLYYPGSYGHYWSSSPNTPGSLVYYLYLTPSSVSRIGNHCYDGQSVRAVCP